MLAEGRYADGSADQWCRDAYATSKLCNILSARHFARLETQSRKYFSFDPGLMPGTGLAREHGRLALAAWNHVLPHLVPLLPGTSSPRRSGAVLSRLARGLLPAAPNGSYFDHRGRVRAPFLPLDEDFMLDDLIRTSDELISERAFVSVASGQTVASVDGSQMIGADSPAP